VRQLSFWKGFLVPVVTKSTTSRPFNSRIAADSHRAYAEPRKRSTTALPTAFLGYFEHNFAQVERLASDLIELSMGRNFEHWLAMGNRFPRLGTQR
jgi:hypothetical protein